MGKFKGGPRGFQLVRNKGKGKEEEVEEDVESEEVSMGGPTTEFFGSETGIILLNEAITHESAANIVDQFYACYAKAPAEPITIYINSPGGDVYSSLMIVDVIRTSPVPVIGVVSGMAGSGALLLLEACHHRLIMPNSLLFWHHVVMSHLLLTVDTPESASKQLNEYNFINKHVQDFFFNRVSLSEENRKKYFDNKNDVTFNAVTSKRIGLVDKIVSDINEIADLQEKLSLSIKKDLLNKLKEKDKKPLKPAKPKAKVVAAASLP